MATSTAQGAESQIAFALEQDERRVRRDSYREAGGSKRRPLKSFMTAREKREARDRHAELIHTAVAELREQDGFRCWVETMALNPQLTPMNAALVAFQSPGEVVATLQQWSKQGARIPKGSHGAGRLTARGFWPLAYFTAAQAGVSELEDFEPELPPDADLEPLRRELVDALDSGERERLALEAVADRVAIDELPVAA